MWSRAVLKRKAKQSVKAFFWPSVLAAFILNFATASGNSAGNKNNHSEGTNQGKTYLTNAFSNRWLGLVIGATAIVVLLCILIGLCISIFVINPLEMGCKKYFLDASNGKSNLGSIGYAFNHNYINTVKVLFFRNLYIFLWTLLLIIPGIIKTYEYRMIPYLLCENPGMTFDEAKEKSRDLMHNEKWNAFVLDLSFILWQIASALTLGLVGLLWVNPYKAYTDVELYKALTTPYQ